MSKRSIALLGGLLWALLACEPAMADDTELFVYDSSVLSVAPNILFVFDTSGSMQTTVKSQNVYDPGTTYTGECDATKVYWVSESSYGGGGYSYYGRHSTPTPDCDSNHDTDRWFPLANLKCKTAVDALKTSAGRYTDHFAQFNPESGQSRDGHGGSPAWEELSQYDHSFDVECESDAGIDGDYGEAGSTTNVWAQDGDADNPWTSDESNKIDWRGSGHHHSSGMSYATVYSGNYLNWIDSPTHDESRSQVLKDVATSLVGSINNVNIGLMRYKDDGTGGQLVQPIEPISTSRSSLVTAINGLPANSNTPLSGTLYEAALYYMGRAPYEGANPGTGVDGDGHYVSPIMHSCQKNYIVYLTDGEPNEGTAVDSKITSLSDNGDPSQSFSSLVSGLDGGKCDKEDYPSGIYPRGGDCFDDLAEFLHKGDMSGSFANNQSVNTYTVGFTTDLPVLAEAAQRGGGQYYTANDTATLSQALTNIVTSILQTQATFTAPTVSVDSFNQTRHRNDVFVTVFQPASTVHWPGNLKKYALRPSDDLIIDSNDLPAVDPQTGFFKEDAQSGWTLTPDGPTVTLGGAANQLPDPSTRHVYTYLGNSDLTDASNAVTTTNTGITDSMLDIGNAGDPSHDDVINFIRGVDVADSNQNNSKTDARYQVGDPLHSQPASIIYGGTTDMPNPDDAVVYFATNDGYLHAVDPNTGIEKWAFVPPEFLGDQVSLLENPTASSKHYGIDGNLRLQVFTKNNDGVIDASNGEKVYLFFGMRRGGDFYYALDVTDPDSPKLLWKLDDSELSGVGETWSNPVPTRINIKDASENENHLVVVFGGGYDETQDNYDTSTDTSGNDIYIVDSVSGTLLWHGGETDATKNFAKMQYSIPADVKVIDLDGDGYADRMYAADMGGQVWRFDITNGETAANLVNGGVIAQLGAAGLDSPTQADTRRFYYSPDVALVSNDTQTFLHIGIGSGYRAHPNSDANSDRFYALRDFEPFKQMTQAEFDERDIVKESDLSDVTDDADAALPADSPGWMIKLGTGEKVLAEARTFNNQIYFTTFTPGAAPDADNCVPRLGTNKLYIVSLFNGAPVTDLDGSVDDDDNLDEKNLTATDRYKELNGSISSEVVFMFPSAEDPKTCKGDACSPPPVACVDLFCMPTNFANNPVRTTWTEDRLDR